MKYLIPLILFTTGCTGSGSSDPLMEELRDVKYELSACKNDLSALQNTPTPDTASAFNNPPEPEKPAEPECYEVDYFEMFQEGKSFASCRDVKETSCGISAEQCTNGYTYNCLTNVKFKSETKRECN